MSCRTLQRGITAEQTTFRRLISDARRELARYYLLQPALELGEGACLPGYEDPNSFFRAFREWERTTPSDCRPGHLGERKQDRHRTGPGEERRKGQRHRRVAAGRGRQAAASHA